jgi:DNA-binding NarL/FixJ family response regulator
MNNLLFTRLADIESRLGRKIRIMIVEDHELFREGLVYLLNTISSVQVLCDVDNSEDLYKQIKIQEPDVILMDIKLKNESGIDITEKIRKLYPQIRIIALTMHDDPSIIMKIISAGACGYILKNTSKEELKQAILNVMQGEEYYCKEAAMQVLQKIARKPIKGFMDMDLKGFTVREVQIIRLICEGKSSKEIADKLFLSSRTVETHRLRIMKKMNVNSVAEMVKFAIKNGFYELE